VSVATNPLHIMRSFSNRLGCGSKSQPWKLQAPVGQQINLNLLDFGSELENTMYPHIHPNCQQYGYVIEKSANKNVSICRLENKRNKIVYRSVSNLIEIFLIGPNITADKNERHILLGFRGRLYNYTHIV